MTRVSVIMAVRDVEPWLDEALDSVLGQVGPDDEVVVVDDGSTDATPRLLAARGDRIVVLRQDPAGIGAARNRALEHSRGRWVASLDGDDRWAPGALDRLVTVLDAHPAVGGVFGRTDEFVDPTVADPAAAGLRPPQTSVAVPFFGAMLLRRDVVDEVRFDPARDAASTPDWLARARARGLVLHALDAVTLERRLRPGSATAEAPPFQQALLATLRSDLARRRGR